MTAGFEVEIDELHRAGAAARSAGKQAHAVDVAGAIAGIAGALPGSRSAHAAAGAAELLQWRITDFSRVAAELGREVEVAADRYTADDDAASDDLSRWLLAWLPNS